MRAPAEIDLAHPRIGCNLVDRAVDEDGAVDEHRGGPREVEDEIHVVLDQDDGHRGRQGLDDVKDLASLAARHADRVLLMGQGRVVADGSPAEVFSDPVCGRTYGVDLVAETSRRGTLMIDAALP